MSLSRRRFVILSAAAATGCKRDTEAQAPATAPSSATTVTTVPSEKIVDVGSTSDFPEEQVSAAFRDQGIFIIRRDKKLFALSAICTHKGCKVRVAGDQSFVCKCHGSTFDPDGKVTKGPATRDLPRLPVAKDKSEHLLVSVK